ncbi:MAG: TIM barrel protein [Pusillimonas sp.]
MIKLCAHLGYQFQEFPPDERIARAAQAGFKAVEWPNPYAFSPRQLRQMLDDHGVGWVQVTLPGGDTAKGEKGLAALPGREREFDANLDQAIDYAIALGAKWIHPMSGTVPDWEAPGVRQTYLRNVERCARSAADHGLGLLIEVINEQEVPGYAMCRYERAREVFNALGGAPRLILDAYHAQNLTGDAIGLARQWAGAIGHVQIADVPGRHEPGTGALNFEAFFAELERGGYDGWVGCEYRPATTTLEGLHHLQRFLDL